MKAVSLERQYQFSAINRQSEFLATTYKIFSGFLVLPLVPVGEFHASE